MNNNVLKYNPAPWRYPSNWAGNIRWFFRRYKWAYQRVTKGYCDVDVWELHSSLLNYLSGTLKELAETSTGYPGNDRFPTPESWEEFLKDLSNDFYRANEDNDYYEHPAYDTWEKSTDLLKSTELSKAMVNELLDLSERRQKDVEIGLDKLKEVFFDLWD